MKQAPKKLLASLLAIALVLSCVIIPQTIISAQATDGEVDVTFSDAFLNTLNITSGDVILHNDYTGYEVGDASAKTGWTGSLGSLNVAAVTPAGTETPVNGLQFESPTSQGYVKYQIPAKNFVLKLNMYTMSTKGGTWNIQILNSSAAVATSLTVPAYNRTDGGQVANNTFALKNYMGGNTTYPSAKGYDLSTQNIDLTMEIVCYNGYFYYVNKSGELIARSPACADSSDTYQLQFGSWGAGTVITEMAVAELVSIEDSFAKSLGASVSESVFYADYKGYNTGDTSDTTYKTDFSATSGTVAIGTVTPYNETSAVTGLKVQNTSGNAYADINFTAKDYVAKVSYVHSSHSGGYSSVILSDESGNFDAAIRFPYSNRNHDDNHYGLLAYKNQINVASSATKVSTYTVGTDVFNFCNTDARQTRNIEIDLYIYSYKDHIYYVKSDGTVIHKSVSYASGPATTLRLYSNGGGIVVKNVDIQALVPDNSVESTFADSINAVVGKTAIYKDYTVHGAVKGDWTSGSISTAAPVGATVMETYEQSSKAENSLVVGLDGGKQTSYYALPYDNFVAKVTFFDARARDALIFAGVADSANAVLSEIKFPSAGRKTEANANQVHFTGKSWVNLDENLYDLSKQGVPHTFYMFCLDDTVYWTDFNGKLIYSNTFVAESGRELMIAGDWTKLTLLDMQVKELTSVYAGGKGTEEAPYMIETADQLYRAVGTFGGSKYYKLANDVYLNDIDAIDWTTGAITKDGYTPVEWFKNTASGTSYIGSDGTTTGSFTGTIDGDGYTVHGIWYGSENRTKASGFLPAVGTATVKNLSIANSYITAIGFVGGICGNLRGRLTVDGFVLEDTVTLHSTWADSAGGGGIVGQISNGASLTVKDTAIYANILAYGSSDAGILGNVWNGATLNITNTISVGYPVAFVNDRNKSNLNYTTSYTFANLYSDKEYDYTLTKGDATYTGLEEAVIELATTEIKGQAALESMAGLFGADTAWYAATTDKYPQLRVWGAAHNDIDKSGVVDTGDLFALRTTILGTAAITYEWTDVNGDAVDADVADLVALKLKKKN